MLFSFVELLEFYRADLEASRSTPQIRKKKKYDSNKMYKIEQMLYEQTPL